jgi:hypothetical protein
VWLSVGGETKWRCFALPLRFSNFGQACFVLCILSAFLCVCAGVPCKLGVASCICFAVLGVINLTLGHWPSI